MSTRISNAVENRNWLICVLGVLWPLAVLAAYLFFNHGYFTEKIGTFGRFLLGGA